MAQAQLAEADDLVEVKDLTLQSVYYLRGPVPKSLRAFWPRYYIIDPPSSGYSRAMVLHGGGNRVTLFSPFSLQAYAIPSNAGEFGDGEVIPFTRERVDFYVDLIVRKWTEFRGYGFQRDYDVAARVLLALGAEVPVFDALDPGGDDRVVRGKAVNARLVRPVRRDSRRGQVAEFFRDGSRSLLEAMASLDMTRSGVLTHLHGLSMEHGFGYELRGDSATLLMPPGCDDPFKGGDARTRKVHVAGTDDEMTAVPAGTKRAAVAMAASDGWKEVSLIAEAAGCTEASVRSHLHDLHAKHGVGFELSPDRRQARLLDPERVTYEER